MSFYVTGGTLGPTAKSYVQRRADQQLLDALLQGQFCYVLTSRQMGKSSLMVRAAMRLNELGVKVAALDLTAIGAQELTPEQWYYGMLDLLCESIGFRERLESFWQDHHTLAPLQRFMNALREVVLPELAPEDDSGPAGRAPAHGPPAAGHDAANPRKVRLVIFLDEIDIVRSLPFSVDAFFAAIRECYNRRAQDPAYERLSFCLLGVATPTDLIRDVRRTPFNVGCRIELDDFTPEEAEPLVPGLVTEMVDSTTARRLIGRIHHWTGGHPYLTQRLCQETADLLRKGAAPPSGSHSLHTDRLVDELCAELFLSHRALKRDPNLSFVSEHLLRNESERASLLHLYGKVWANGRVPDDELDGLANQLLLAGIVRASEGRLVVRNRIYARAFDREWLRANMPEAALRREREAFRRGALLAAAVTVAVLAIIAGLTVLALKAVRGARLDSARASYSQALVHRMSGRSGQRAESLSALERAARSFTNRAQLLDQAAATLALRDLQPVRGWLWDRTGRVTAVSSDLSVAAQAESDGSVILFHPGKDAELARLPKAGGPPRRLRFSPQGDVLLIERKTGSESRMTLWKWAEGRELMPALGVGIEGRAVDFSPDGRRLAVGTAEGTIDIYSLPSGDRVQELTLRLTTGGLRTPDVIRFHPSGDLLAESCSYEHTVQLWRVADGVPVGDGAFHPATVHDIAWGDGGRLLGSACSDETVRIWSTNNLAEPRSVLRGHSGDVLRLAFSHAGNLVASVGRDQTTRLWSLAEERQLVFRETEPIEEISFSADDRHLICVGPGQTNVDLLEVQGGEYITLRGEAGAYEVRSSLDFSPDGRRLLADFTGRLVVFDLEALREEVRLDVLKSHGACFTPDGQVLEISDRGLFQYPVPGGRPFRQLYEGLADLTAMAMSPDRKRCAVVRRDQVLVFDMGSLSLVSSNVLGKHHDYLALHPSQPWLAGMAAGSRSIDVWNLAVTPAATVSSIPDADEHFAFDCSGHWLVVAQLGGFRLLEVGNWREVPMAAGQRRAGTAGVLALNAAGTLLAVASSRNVIELWSLHQTIAQPQPELLVRLEARNHPRAVAFSADGTWLGAITRDGRGPLIELWNLQRLWPSLKPFLESSFRLPELTMN